MYDAIGCTTTAAWPEELAATADLVVCLPPRKKKEEEGRRQKRERKRFELVRANRVCDANGDAQQNEVWREEMLGSKKSIVEDRDSTRSLGVFLSLRK